MRTFTVNGIEYNAKPFDFNLACELEDRGIALSVFISKPNVAMRSYFAVCANMSLEKAGNELNAHYVAGNTLGELAEAMNAELDASDFFQQMVQQALKAMKEKKAENQSAKH